jgi:hypothetical protein
VTTLRVLPNITPDHITSDRTTGPTDLSIVPGLSIVSDLELVPETPLATRYVMRLLADGVPLSLLFDLADPAGPPSADMVSSETNGHSLIRDLLAFRADVVDRAGNRTRAAVGSSYLG